MTQGFPIQATFARGELSPRLHSRVDIDYYKAGLATCRNFFVMRQGGLRRRPGTQFIAATKDSSRRSRVVKFIFSQAQAYIIEFGHLYCRFYALGGQVQTSPGVAYEIVTPYTESDIFGLQFAQSADVLYVAHRNYAPRKIIRAAETSWSVSVIDFLDGPYLPVNVTTTTLQPSGSAAGATITITASSVNGINNSVGFKTTDVGRHIRILHGAVWGWAKITARTDATHVTAVVGGSAGATSGAFGATTAQAVWELGSWGDDRGYPGRVGFFQERLIWASSPFQPQTIWASQTADFENMATSTPAADDDALNLTIVAGSVQQIQWIQEGKDLLIGTTSTARTLGPSDRGAALTNTNLVQQPQANFGAIAVQPVQVGNVTLFATFYGASVREFVYSFDVDAYVAPEVTLLSEHILRPGIVQMAYCAEPDSVIYMALADYRLGGLTYEKDQKMVALVPHEIGGTHAGLPYACVESVDVIPGPDRTELWMVVTRTINGQTKRYIERMTAAFEDMDIEDAFFVDSGLTYDGAATNQLTGMGHLEGETVLILADGTEIRNVVVTGGVVTLPGGRLASRWTIGIPYRSYGKTLRVPAQQDGSLIGRKVAAKEVIFDFLESASLEISSGGNAHEWTQRRKSTAKQGDPIPLYTGTVKIPVDAAMEDGGAVEFECSHARPVTIRSIAPGYEAEP